MDTFLEKRVENTKVEWKNEKFEQKVLLKKMYIIPCTCKKKGQSER